MTSEDACPTKYNTPPAPLVRGDIVVGQPSPVDIIIIPYAQPSLVDNKNRIGLIKKTNVR